MQVRAASLYPSKQSVHAPLNGSYDLQSGFTT